MDALVEFLTNKNKWSLETFGEGQRAEGICKHIESELEEIRETPEDLMEWIDVILLAFDGAFRAGYDAQEVVDALVEKQFINTKRKWKLPEADEPSFHEKS